MPLALITMTHFKLPSWCTRQFTEATSSPPYLLCPSSNLYIPTLPLFTLPVPTTIYLSRPRTHITHSLNRPKLPSNQVPFRKSHASNLLCYFVHEKVKDEQQWQWGTKIVIDACIEKKKKQARRLVCTNSPNDVLDDVHEIFKWVINQLSVA